MANVAKSAGDIKVLKDSYSAINFLANGENVCSYTTATAQTDNFFAQGTKAVVDNVAKVIAQLDPSKTEAELEQSSYQAIVYQTALQINKAIPTPAQNSGSDVVSGSDVAADQAAGV